MDSKLILNSGILTYITLNGMIYVTKVVSRGHIVPEDEDNREYWTYKPGGQLPWFIRAAKAPKDFFRPQEPREQFQLGHDDGSVHGSVNGSRPPASPLREKDLDSIVVDQVRVPSTRGMTPPSYQ